MKNNIKKLAVGVENVEHLKQIQAERFERLGYGVCYTTMCPTKVDKLIAVGSLYWIIKGQISARQKIVDFESYRDETDKKRTKIILDGEVIETERHYHRPFQGWRYLTDNDVPKDLDKSKYKDIDSGDLEKLGELGIL